MVAPRPSVADDDLEARLLRARLDRARQGIRGQTGYAPLAPSVDRSTLGGTGAQFVYGVNSRLADVFSAPMRLAEAAVSPIFKLLPEGSGASQRHVPTPIEGFLRDEGNANQPQGTFERIGRRAGEEVGATLPFAGMPYMAAAAIPAGRMATTTGQRVIDTILNTVRAAPGGTAAAEAAATVGSGTGAGIAGEVAPGNMGAEMAGQLAGGIAPVLMPSRLMYQAGNQLFKNYFSGPAAQRQATQAVSKEIGSEMSNQALRNIDRADELRDRIPGFNPSLAETTGSPSIMATQRAVESRMSGRELEQAAMRREASRDAIDRFAGNVAPEGGGGPEFVIDTLSGRITSLRERITGKAAEVADQRRQMANTIPNVNRRQTGETIRTGLEDARRAASQDMTKLANDLGISSANVTIPFTTARRELVALFGQKSVFEDLKNYPAVLESIREAPTQVTFMDMKALRERLTDDLTDAYASPFGRTKKVRILRALQKQVDTIIDTLVDAADPGLAAAYRQFRDTYRRDFIDRFEHGMALEVRRRDGSGYYRTNDEEVARDFFEPGGVTAAQQFKRIFGNDPAMTASLESYALDSLRDAAVRNGELDPRLFATWQRRHAEVLAQFPSLGRQLANYESGLAAVARREAQLQARQQTIGDQLLVKKLRSYDNGTRTAEQLISDALADPRLMAQIVRRVRGNGQEGTAAFQALRRHVWDTIAGGNAAQVRDFLGKHQAALRQLFGVGGDHLGNLATIADAREMLGRIPDPSGQGISARPFGGAEKTMGMGLPQASSRLFAVESGRLSGRWMATDAFGRFWRARSQRELEALWKRALYSPETARDLAALARTEQPPQGLIARIKAELLSLGFSGPGSNVRPNTRLPNLGLTSREGENDQRQ